MDILLVCREKLIRDQVKVGLQQFPEFGVTVGEGYAALNQLRQRHYDCVFLSMDPDDAEGLRLLNHLRTFDRTTEVVPITTKRHARDLAGEKTRLNIAAFLHTPIQPDEFFRVVGRLRDRRIKSAHR